MQLKNTKEIAYDIIQSSSGDLMVLGQSYSVDGDVTYNWGGADLLLLKLDVNGDKIWGINYEGEFNEINGQMIQSSTGDFVIAASTPSYFGNVPGNSGSYDVWTFAVDNNGTLLRNKTFGSNGAEYFSDIIQGYLAIGYTNSSSINVTG